tara:strand:- start:193 stop:621 length:429 start_codon:yes stop_codon:yes gene_type:complete
MEILGELGLILMRWLIIFLFIVIGYLIFKGMEELFTKFFKKNDHYVEEEPLKIHKIPKKHMIKDSWEDFSDDPFYGLAFIASEVSIGDVAYYESGSWAGIYWQKGEDNCWTTSRELHVSLGGDEQCFDKWAKENESLKNPIQ